MLHKLFSTLFIGILIGVQGFSGNSTNISKVAILKNPFSSELTKKSDSIVIKQYDFEKNSDFSSWQVKKGNLTLSDHHFKDGKKSLLWEWKKKDILKIENLEGLERAASPYKGGIPEYYEPAFYEAGNYGGIKVWLYQDSPTNGDLVFQLGSDLSEAKNNPKYKFVVHLNFKGWRAIWVNLEEDALVEGYKGSDTIKSLISFPSNTKTKKGNLYIDHLTLLDFVSYKRHSDQQFVNHKKGVRTDSYKILDKYNEYLTTTFSSENFDKEQLLLDNKLISDRLEYLILGNNSDVWKHRNSKTDLKLKAAISKANKEYKSLEIRNTINGIQGVPLFTSRDEHGADNGKEFQKVSEATMFPLAVDFRLNGNQESKEKLFNLLEYFEDQGWAAGSSLGTVDHIIRLNGIAQSIFLLREDLAKMNILNDKEAMLAWHSRIGGILDIDYSKAENTDKVRGGALVKLVNILLMENSPKKEAYLKLFKEYMDYVVAIAPGYGDTIKPDFSIFHHRGTYLNTYGIQAVNTMALIHWLLEGTPYALSQESTEILKETILKQSDIAFGEDLHFGVCGRFPEKNSAIGNFLLPAYAFMSASEDTIVDKNLAKRFAYLYDITNPESVNSILFPSLTYSGTFGTLDLMVKIKEQTKEEISTPKEGNYTMPYSSMSVHRIGNAYAAVKGYNKYVWDFETGSSKGENNLGRYLSFGALFVAQNNPEKGFKGAGIDYNNGFHTGYFPGATTKKLPAEEMLFINKSTEKYKEGYHRSYSQTTFANGLSQNGENGIYAMELRDDVSPDKDKILFDNSFRAKKSYFFLGNEIICLGSNIENDDNRYQTITTLFQYKQKEGGITSLNGKSIGEKVQIKKIKKGFITDVNGIHYILHNNSDIIIEQGEQNALQRVGEKYKTITIPHIKSYISHGVSPKNKGYEYQILLNSSIEVAKQLCKEKSYNVLTKNSQSHSIYHPKLKTTAYAIFSEKSVFKDGPIIKVDTPMLAMFKKEGTKAILSIANPDLQLPPWNHNMSHMPEEIVNGMNSGSVITITLDGEWSLAKRKFEVVHINYNNGNTELKIYTKEGKSIDIQLQEKK